MTYKVWDGLKSDGSGTHFSTKVRRWLRLMISYPTRRKAFNIAGHIDAGVLFSWRWGRRDGQRVWPVNRGLDPDGSNLEKGLASSKWNTYTDCVTCTSTSCHSLSFTAKVLSHTGRLVDAGSLAKQESRSMALARPGPTVFEPSRTQASILDSQLGLYRGRASCCRQWSLADP